MHLFIISQKTCTGCYVPLYVVLIFLSFPVRPRIFTMLLRPAVSILTDIRLLIYLEDSVAVAPLEEALLVQR